MLPPAALEAWEEIRKGQPFPFGWLATADAEGVPHVRTIRLMGFNFQQRKLYFASHKEHDKIRHLNAQPRVELCFVRLGEVVQMRFQGKAKCFADHPLRAGFWKKLSPQTKVELYGGHPQRENPPECFLLAEVEIADVDLLRLHTSPGQRVKFRWRGDGYDAQPVPL